VVDRGLAVVDAAAHPVRTYESARHDVTSALEHRDALKAAGRGRELREFDGGLAGTMMLALSPLGKRGSLVDLPDSTAIAEGRAAATIVEGVDGSPAGRFIDPAVLDELEGTYGAAGRGGVDVRHSPEIEVPFGKGIDEQGYAYEDYLASRMPAENRLPEGFQTYDFFEDQSRAATSAKTLDTTTVSRILNPRRVYDSLRRNVNAAVNFERYQLKGVELSSSDVSSRTVRVAVPRETNSEQWAQIMRSIRYAEERNVRLIPEVVSNSSR
jgi:hypothetical protein